MSGYFALIYYSTTIFENRSTYSEHGAIVATVLLGLVDIVGLTLFALFSDRTSHDIQPG